MCFSTLIFSSHLLDFVCVCVHVYIGMGLENHLKESVFSLYLVGSVDLTQVVRLGTSLLSLGHLATFLVFLKLYLFIYFYLYILHKAL